MANLTRIGRNLAAIAEFAIGHRRALSVLRALSREQGLHSIDATYTWLSIDDGSLNLDW
ncbi:hypothetical protein [Micropruina sonneratiae]|uniref:hypothetical protein n=1 Tax=Micropruina sonneratiae TaxID=2986940 RepID=UPI002227C619|nr:hypothetical protein [Micropruina sp. KQZ13P-5]MCW3157396.1 hypothetical protein [Micropruina sp. KQZ13P-5]